MRRFIVFFSVAALALGTGLAIFLNRTGSQSEVVKESERVPAQVATEETKTVSEKAAPKERSGLPTAKLSPVRIAPTPSVIDQYWKQVEGPLSPETATVLREKKVNFKKEHAARSNAIKSLRGKGKPVLFNHETDRYELVSRLRALPEKDFSPAMGFKVIDNSGGYVFVEVGPKDPIPHNSVPVAMNSSTQSLGAMTGLYSLKLSDVERTSEVISEFKLNLVQAFDNIQTVFVRSDRNSGEDLVSLLEEIRKDPRIQRADLEIMERLHAPR